MAAAAPITTASPVSAFTGGATPVNLASSFGQQPTPQPTPNPATGVGLAAGEGVNRMVPPAGPTADQIAGANYAASVTNPTPTPAFMTPAVQAYINQFQQSQGAQQQALNSGLSQALLGLGQRRDAAAKVAATLPETYQQSYNQATQDQQAATQAANVGALGAHTAIAPSGVTQAAVKADNQAVSSSNANQLKSGLASQPLINAGITADTSQGQTALANTNMQNEASLAQQQQAFDQQLALAQMGYQQSANQQAATYANDAKMAQLNSSLGVSAYKAENPNGALTPAQTEAANNQQALDQQAIANGFTNYAQFQQTQQSPGYSWAVSALQGNNIVSGNGPYGAITPGQIPKGNVSAIVKYLAADPLVLNALVANHLLTGTQVAAAGV